MNKDVFTEINKFLKSYALHSYDFVPQVMH